MKDYDIGVLIVTYNQKKYIKTAIEGVLSQQTKASIHVYIHDDCSNDGTYEIISEYEKLYPDLITILRPSVRTFIKLGFNKMIYQNIVPFLRCKYVAYCDGDDYWIDNKKLEKQYAFMEAHPTFSMCFHNSYQLKPNGDMKSKWYIGKERELFMSDIITDKPGICIATSSVFIKKSVFINFPNWRLDYPVEDIPMYINAIICGRVYRLKDIMCVYRQCSVGSWTEQNSKNSERIIQHMYKTINGLNQFNKETKYEYFDLVSGRINWSLFRIGLVKKDFNLIFAKQNRRFFKRLPFKMRLSLKLQYRVPYLYDLLHNNRKAS